jgi:hypothetical protein
VYAAGHQIGTSEFNYYGPGTSTTPSINVATNPYPLTSGSGVATKPVIVKYSSAGIPGGAKTVESASYNAEFKSIVLDGQGNVYAAGFQTDSAEVNYGDNIKASGAATGANSVIVKYDSNFTTQWAKPVAGSAASAFNGIALDGSGGIYAVGYQTDIGVFTYGGAISAQATGGSVLSTNSVIVKYDSGNGDALWAQAVTGGGDQSQFQGLVADGSGGVYVVGYQSGTGEFNYGNNIKRPGTGLYGGSGGNALVVRYK